MNISRNVSYDGSAWFCCKSVAHSAISRHVTDVSHEHSTSMYKNRFVQTSSSSFCCIIHENATLSKCNRCIWINNIGIYSMIHNSAVDVVVVVVVDRLGEGI